jgi:hypothetical protein
MQLQHPSRPGQLIDVDPDHKARYLSQGWVEVPAEPPAPTDPPIQAGQTDPPVEPTKTKTTKD